jgi:hypothetical protein
MSKLYLRTCVVALAASLVLALVPVPSHASGLPARAAHPPAQAPWLDAARATLTTLIPILPPAAPRAAKPQPARPARGHHPSWLLPSCSVLIDPGGNCV